MIPVCPSRKVVWLSGAEARRQSKKTAGQTAYKCQHCPHWHLTSSSKRMSRRHRIAMARRRT